VLKSALARYAARSRAFFRAYACFANPDVYAFLEG
jgi:hypothetical protein